MAYQSLTSLFQNNQANPNNSYGGLFNRPPMGQKAVFPQTKPTDNFLPLSQSKTPTGLVGQNGSPVVSPFASQTNRGSGATPPATPPVAPTPPVNPPISTPIGNSSVADINAARASAVASGQNPYAGAGATSTSTSAGLGNQNTQTQNNGNPNNQNNPITGLPNTPTNAFGGVLNTAANSVQNETPQVAQARQDLKNLQMNEANIPYLAGAGEGISLDTVQGRIGVAQQKALAQESALGNALSSATASQGQRLGLLPSLLGASKPTVEGYGQTSFNPSTGQFGNGSSGAGVSPSDPYYQTLQQYAQMYASGQQGAIPSSVTGNSVLNAQVLGMAKQINPNFNYNTAQGSASAQQSNTALSGTATPNAANSVYQKAYSEYQNLQQNVSNVDQFGSLLTSNMVSGGINPSDIKYANQTISQIRSQLSSQAQGQFDTTFAALKSKVSGMLAVGGAETPTALTNDANSILSGNVPIGTLNAVLQRIQQEGTTLLGTQAQKLNSAKDTLSGVNNNQTNGQSTNLSWSNI
jgi:hypothetical protein